METKINPINIIPKGSIFFNPLTIRYEKEPTEMLFRLIHELIHNNLMKKKFKNPYLLHKYMDKKTIRLLKELSIDLNKHLPILERMTNKWKIKCNK